MPTRRSFVHLDVDPSASRPPARERDASRVSVLLLADFSARGPAAPPEPPTARAVDRDTVDAVLARLAPTVSLGEGDSITFRALDDFHPDALLDRVPALGAALDGRDVVPPPTDPDAGATAPPAAGVLDAILDDAAPARPSAPPPAGPVDSIRAFAAEVARYDAAAPDDADHEARAQRAGHALRAFLRVSAFRDLERRWRAVDFVVRRLDTGPRLHVHLADLSRGALAAEAESPGGLGASALARLLKAGAGPDGEPWTYVALLDGSIGPSPDDQVLLAWTTALCAAFGATLLVDGEPSLAGIAHLDDFTDPTAWGGVHAAWSAFRQQPEAGAVGAAAPGFLLRVPYGPDTDSVDRLPDFEEIPGRPRPDDYLVGPAAAACVVALTRARLREKDGRAPDLGVGGVPLHMWSSATDSGVTGGVVPMTDRAARRMLEAGMIPVAWTRGADEVRVLVPRTAGGTPLT